MQGHFLVETQCGPKENFGAFLNPDHLPHLHDLACIIEKHSKLALDTSNMATHIKWINRPRQLPSLLTNIVAEMGTNVVQFKAGNNS
jgi:type II restriction/modification system DNA methylase subunit YeeA